MERIWTAAQLKEADSRTMRQGLSSPVLMERAALAVMEVLTEEKLDLSGTVVFCGTGNNGGDGIVVARLLAERGFHPVVVAAGDPSRYSTERKQQEELLRTYDVCIVPAEDIPDLTGKTLIVDALFGIGLSRMVQEPYAGLIRTINDSGLPVVAVDIPSGVHTDTGQVLGCAVKASCTVSFSGPKAGLYQYPGKTCAGRVYIRKIGIRLPADMPEDREFRLVTKEDLSLLPDRAESGNKGTFGKILVIAGSRCICGAAYLSAKACLRSGAGMVKIYTEEANRQPLAASFPEALLETYCEETWEPDGLEAALDWADAVLIGPGIGTGKTAKCILEYVCSHSRLPLVLDADALNLLQGCPDMLRACPGPCVITPHVMEMSRLTGEDCATIKADSRKAAEALAEKCGACVVLKDAHTVIADADGTSYLYAEGSSALATAGSGDVLAGILTAFLFHLSDQPSVAAALAVCLHGTCGNRAAAERSEAAVLAGDLIDHIRI